MTVERRQVQLARNAETIERLHRRLFRTVHALEAAVKQRKRLLKPRPLPVEATGPELNDSVPSLIKQAAPMGMVNDGEPVVPMPNDDLDIPAKFRRYAAMPDPKTKEKKAERKAIEKEVRQAEITGKRRKMPLSGKAALEAIHKAS